MNILLLGATGYLGGNLVYKLVEKGHRVFCVVRASSELTNLINLDVSMISNDTSSVEICLRTSKIDWIINAICTYKQNNTLYGDMLESNIIFPLKILNLAIKYGVKNYITIGTSLPNEFNLYSFTKHQFSNFGKYLCDRNDINFADLQLEMFYGGLFEPKDRFLNSCRIKLQIGEDIQLTDGYQKRDIIRIEDVVEIITKLIETNYITGYKVLPIGTGENHSIREIVSYMKECLASDSELQFGVIRNRNDEPDTLSDVGWYADINYKLQFSYFEGLKEECNRY